MADDVELLRRYANERSEEAFTALVQRHLPLVYHAALRRTNGDAHLAEDVAQAVFANLAQEAGSLQRHAMLGGWLYVATRHAAANAMRTENRRRVREQEAQAMNEISAPEIMAGEWERLRPELDSVMDELGEADRNAVLLRFFENRPYAEIGASFQISEDAARMRVDRSLEKLRALLGRRGITSTAAALGGLLAAQSAMAAPTGLATAVAGSVLAGAGIVAGAGSAGLIAFMTTNKIMMGIAGAVALVAGGTAVYEYREARLAETAIIGLSRDKADLQSQLAKQGAQVRVAEEKYRMAEERAEALAKSSSEAGSAKNSGAPATSSNAAKALAASSFVGKMDILYANPEYVQLEMERALLGLRTRYGPPYRRLGLSDAQILEFESLMLEQQQATIDMFAAARTKGVSVNDPRLRQLSDPAYAAVQAKLKALLGSEGNAALKEFTSPGAGMARSTVDSLAMRLYATDPITPEQADKLTEVIAAHTTKPTQGTGFFMENGQPDWTAIYAQAKDIISPSQLAALEASNRSSEISMQQAQLSDKLLQQAAASAVK